VSKTSVEELRAKLEQDPEVREKMEIGLSQEKEEYEDKDELDFSREPIFDDSGNVTEKIFVPGVPSIWFTLRTSVPFAVTLGRGNFATQEQAFAQAGNKRKPENKVRISYNAVGLLLYKIEQCVVDYEIKDPISGKVSKGSNVDPMRTGATTKRHFSDIKSTRIMEWISEQIDKAVGWDMEAEEDAKAFPE
jgi:hypothetical protein